MKPQGSPSTTAHPFAALCVLTSVLALVVLAGCGGADDPPDREQLVPQGMRRTTVTAQDAGTRVTTATETATPAAAPPKAETPEAAAAVAPEPPTVAPPDDGQASVAPAPAEIPAEASPGSWTVQAGAFTRAETAAGVADTLRRAGIAATVETADVGGTTYRRVVVNGLADRAAADALVARLKGEFAMNALVRGTHAAGQ